MLQKRHLFLMSANRQECTIFVLYTKWWHFTLFQNIRAMIVQNCAKFGIYTFMGCCKLAQVDVRKWLSHFFTHIHEYDNDYSRDLMELLPHNLKQKGILWHPLKILQDSWLIPRILENPTRFWKYLQYFRRNPAIRGLLMAYEKLVSTNYKWKV